MHHALKVLGFAGSLRKASFNRGVLRAAQELAPEDVKIEIFDLAGIPIFNQDEESDPPGPVVSFREKIKAADALLVATPEYNYSIPGVLKNALDWASRPYGQGAILGKPVAVMGASVGMLGSARAQYDLRRVFQALNMPAVSHPEVLIAFASKLCDGQGNVTDEKTRGKIRELVEALAVWTRRLLGVLPHEKTPVGSRP